MSARAIPQVPPALLSDDDLRTRLRIGICAVLTRYRGQPLTPALRDRVLAALDASLRDVTRVYEGRGHDLLQFLLDESDAVDRALNADGATVRRWRYRGRP